MPIEKAWHLRAENSSMAREAFCVSSWRPEISFHSQKEALNSKQLLNDFEQLHVYQGSVAACHDPSINLHFLAQATGRWQVRIGGTPSVSQQFHFDFFAFRGEKLVSLKPMNLKKVQKELSNKWWHKPNMELMWSYVILCEALLPNLMNSKVFENQAELFSSMPSPEQTATEPVQFDPKFQQRTQSRPGDLPRPARRSRSRSSGNTETFENLFLNML